MPGRARFRPRIGILCPAMRTAATASLGWTINAKRCLAFAAVPGLLKGLNLVEFTALGAYEYVFRVSYGFREEVAGEEVKRHFCSPRSRFP